MTKSKRIAVLVLVVAAAAASTQLLRSRGARNPEPFLAEAGLSDGASRFRLLKAVEGPLDYDWKDPTPPLLRMLPPPIGTPHVPFVPVQLDGLTRDQFPGVSFYFRPVDEQGRYSMGPRSRFIPGIEFEESTGFVFRSDGPFPQPDFSPFGTAALTVSALPRRDATLKILIHEDRAKPGGKPLVMQIPNPVFKPEFPVWESEELPATKAVDKVWVTLNGFKISSFDGVRPDLSVNSNVKGWRPHHRAWLEDATGNRGNRLSPFEPAWKVRVALDPRPDGVFPPERVWKVGAFLRPPKGEFRELKSRTQIAGIPIQRAVLSGAGCLRVQNGELLSVPSKRTSQGGVSSSLSSTTVNGRLVQTHDLECSEPFLWVNHSALDFESIPFARIVSGEQVIVGNVGRHQTNGQHSSIITFKEWPDDQMEWTLEFVITPRPTVDFLVTPPPEIRDALMKPPQENGKVSSLQVPFGRKFDVC